MAVPLLDVNAQNLPIAEDLTAAFQQVSQHGWFILGPEVGEFEKEAAEFLGVSHAIGVSSGTDALLLALMALEIGPGDEVLCPSFTFYATAGAVSRVGATPVFVDSCPVCFNIDVEAAREKITSKTKAIIPVHLFGQSADMDAVMALAEENDLKVIEDAAQAFGSKTKGQICGSIGDFGTYSFFPTKNLGALGDAGMVVTNDAALAELATIMRVHGGKPKYYHHVVGGNFRIDSLQAAFLSVKLHHYPEYTAGRQVNATDYLEKLLELDGVVQADPAHCRCAEAQGEWIEDQAAKIVLPVAYGHNEHIWNQFTIRVIGEGRRDALRQHLADSEIGSEIYYPVTMDQQPCFQDLPESSKTGCQVAQRLAEEVLSIPIYAELNGAQRDEVVAAVGSFLRG